MSRPRDLRSQRIRTAKHPGCRRREKIPSGNVRFPRRRSSFLRMAEPQAAGHPDCLTESRNGLTSEPETIHLNLNYRK